MELRPALNANRHSFAHAPRWAVALAPAVIALTTASAEPPRASSQSTRANFAAYADPAENADAVVLEAERLQERFVREFGLDRGRSRIPIVIVFGEGGDAGAEDGVVRVFPHGRSVKLQLAWDETPVPEDDFRQSWVRALCTRVAAEGALQQARLGPHPDEVPELRVPIWVTDGVASLLSEPATLQDLTGRATLWARTDPLLTLGGALAELEGRPSLDPSQRALAAAICRALLADAPMRKRFFANLNWPPKATAKDWLAVVTQRQDLNAWWRDLWKAQAANAVWVKWAYRPTRDWLLRMEDAENRRAAVALPAGGGMSHTELASVAHPWFRPLVKWRVTQEDHSLIEEELVKIRRSIESRRDVAMEWFAPFETKEGSYTRDEWLAWERRHRAALNADSKPGPIAAWFGSFAKTPGAVTPPARNPPAS